MTGTTHRAAMRRARRTGWLTFVVLLLATGCQREERTLGDALRDLPQDTMPADVIPPAEQVAADTMPPLGTSPPPEDPDGLTPDDPQDVIPWVPEERPVAPAPEDDQASTNWTAGIMQRRSTQGVATVRSVRSATNPGYDRVVFELAGGHVPGYHIEYIDRPVRECGTGNAVPLSGHGWLRVRLEPARMHTDAGEPTVAERHRRVELPVIRVLRSICDFEAQVEWVLAVNTPNRYRVLELSDPARLVVDVAH
jgi:hypothetical protein